jgi:hypothetical protein
MLRITIVMVEALAKQIVKDVVIFHAHVTSFLKPQTAQDAAQPFFLALLHLSRKPANEFFSKTRGGFIMCKNGGALANFSKTSLKAFKRRVILIFKMSLKLKIKFAVFFYLISSL